MPMRLPPLLRFWLPLLAAVTALGLVHALGGGHPDGRSVAMALLLTATMALSGYLFAVIARPEAF